MWKNAGIQDSDTDMITGQLFLFCPAVMNLFSDPVHKKLPAFSFIICREFFYVMVGIKNVPWHIYANLLYDRFSAV